VILSAPSLLAEQLRAARALFQRPGAILGLPENGAT